MSGGLLLRKLRLASGVLLALFVAIHLLNLAVGLRSVEAMDGWRRMLMAPWYTPVGQAFLAGSVLVHAGLGLVTTARRRSFALGGIDGLQLVLGLATPPLVMAHVLMMRLTGDIVQGFDASYATILSLYWSVSPLLAIQQLMAVVAVWVHAAIGLYAVLVLRPVWTRIKGIVLPLLFAVPILAMLGFAQAGQTMLARLADDPASRAKLDASVAAVRLASPMLGAIQTWILGAYGVLVVAALGLWMARSARLRPAKVRVGYDGGLAATGRPGLSILEIGRLAGIAHAHVCSGRGRCGTCRVEVTAGAEHLSEVGDIERDTLAGLPQVPGLRLACQARLREGSVRVRRILPAYADAGAARHPLDWAGDLPAMSPANAPAPR